VPEPPAAARQVHVPPVAIGHPVSRWRATPCAAVPPSSRRYQTL
jgi:hypothetical protein